MEATENYRVQLGASTHGETCQSVSMACQDYKQESNRVFRQKALLPGTAIPTWDSGW
jgi:hypothetical protein